MTDFEARRQRHVREALGLVPALSDSLSWPAERIAAERNARLRALVQVAVDSSPWHRKRLAGFDPGTAGVDLLAQLPVMTKDDLMGHFDEVVTDPRLTLTRVDSHLDGLPESGYLLGRYTAIASGGSSGRRGCFVYDWTEMAMLYVGWFRYFLRRTPGRPGPVIANVAAGHPSHGTAAVSRLFTGPHLSMTKFPVTLPTTELVAGLNECDPAILIGYPSALHLLTGEAVAGRLRVAPSQIMTFAEPLLPEVRFALESTWGVPVGNMWGASEGGPLGIPCDAAGTHLSEDLLIIEAVDDAGRPVPDGEPAAKVFLTNLYNHTMPMIRLEITDQITVLTEPCTCGSAHRRIADIQGRLDDYFDYAGVRVHPHVFRSALGHHSQVVEYQVRQEPHGAAITLRCMGPVDAAALTLALETGLRRVGVVAPSVSLEIVDRIERGSMGKLKRFVPLGDGR